MREVPVPEPGPGQVLLKVGGAGACHSDLHLMEWPEGTMDYDGANRRPASGRRDPYSDHLYLVTVTVPYMPWA
jgi:hypothetical protein